MSIRDTAWPTGTPNWVHLQSTDREGSWAFYESLMGWKIVDGGPDVDHYGIALADGHAAAGLGGKAPGDSSPSAWITYLATDDAAATAEAIAAHGGTVIAGPHEITDLGVMAMATDPTGAMFGIWQARKHIGCSIVNEPGGLVWNEHTSNDPEAARAFYGAVFGHTFTVMEGDLDYTTIDGDGPGGVIGGLGAMRPDVPEGTPAHWLAYFAVADADAAAAAVTAAGGRVLAGPSETPYGKMAVFADPTGAVFAVMGLAPQPAGETG
jgi:predicted enzyme related to lactoylglutathione lyase